MDRRRLIGLHLDPVPLQRSAHRNERRPGHTKSRVERRLIHPGRIRSFTRAEPFQLAEHERLALGGIERLDKGIEHRLRLSGPHPIVQRNHLGVKRGQGIDTPVMPLAGSSMSPRDAPRDTGQPRAHRCLVLDGVHATIRGEEDILPRVIQTGRGQSPSREAATHERVVLQIQRLELPAIGLGSDPPGCGATNHASWVVSTIAGIHEPQRNSTNPSARAATGAAT